MGFNDEVAEAFDLVTEELQDRVTWGATSLRFPVNKDGTDATGAADYRCLPSPSTNQLDLMAGGFRGDYQFSITVRRADFTTFPSSGSLILKGGRVVRIEKMDDSEVSPLVVFHCTTPEK